MLFNSHLFIFVFLPLVLACVALAGRAGGVRGAIVTLLLASLLFYGYWNPLYLLLLGASIGVNFVAGRTLADFPRKPYLAAAVAFNLGLLGYFKYADFFVTNLNGLGLGPFAPPGVVLPLAISFFTFQQIAYLVDCFRDRHAEQDLRRYALFVCFFPQLIAGPIVHHREMMPQFARGIVFSSRNAAVAVSIFFAGLFKKVVIADGMSVYADAYFGAADAGLPLAFFEAWLGVLAFTFQIYFDFSGYCDMAVGLALLFGIRLPVNFFSPYKATSIIEFWRRWHITLSRFLRDYLYFPLGGNRRGVLRRYRNLLITMLLGGLWHGAAWHFILWGGYHGLGLMANHGFRRLSSGRFTVPAPLAVLMTFVFVVAGWVLFRAETLSGSGTLLSSMFWPATIDLPRTLAPLLAPVGDGVFVFGGMFPGDFNPDPQLGLILCLSLIAFCWLLPNTVQVFAGDYGLDECQRTWNVERAERLGFRPSPTWAAAVWAIGCAALLGMTRVQEFLYFQF